MRSKGNMEGAGKAPSARLLAVFASQKAAALIPRLVPAMIFVLTILAFLPVLHNGFVGWDDADNLLENPQYRGLGWSHLRWMFTTFYMTNYRPLTWMSHGLDYLLWGMEPWGYHLTSLLVHAAVAVAFYFVALRLLLFTMGRPESPAALAPRMAAGISALLFSLHPLRVESVAWASARNDVLAGLFYVLTLLCYLRAVEAGDRTSDRRVWMGAAVAVYALSLLSKGMGITLPVVLFVLDVYPLRRLGGGPGRWLGSGVRAVWLEKSPFLLLALIGGVLALVGKAEGGLLVSVEQHGVGSRLVQALFGLSFYLWKTFFPLPLSPIYELPTHLEGWQWHLLPGALFALALAAGLWLFRQKWPSLLAVSAFYAAALIPVLGIAQYGPQIAADRYSYIACLGWALLAGAAFLCLWRLWEAHRVADQTAAIAVGLVVLLLSGLGALTWKQTQIWHDSETLWRHVLSVTEGSIFKSSFAHYNLGAMQAERGEFEEAIGHYRRSLELYPAYPKAHYNLAIALSRQGKLEEALEQYRRTLQLAPAHFKAHINLGNLLARQGRFPEAVEHYQEALRIEPDSATALFNLGLAVLDQGALKEAVVYFRRALRSRPDFAEAHESLAVTLFQLGRKKEAVEHYEEAVRIMKSRRAAGAGS